METILYNRTIDIPGNPEYTLGVVNYTTQPQRDIHMNPLTQQPFVKGETVTFKYHDKLRVGRVEKVGATYVVLEHDEEHPEHKTKFQSYSFSKIQPV